MATDKERIVISMEPERVDVIRRLAYLQQMPMSKVVIQLIEQVEPMLIEIVAALEAAQEAKGKPAAQLIAALSKMQTAVQGASQQAVDQVDMFSGKMTRTIAKVKADGKTKAKAGARAKPAKPK